MPSPTLVFSASGAPPERVLRLVDAGLDAHHHAVAPEHRTRGVGSRLLHAFEAHARGRGCTVFCLTTLSYQAPAFYRKHGYEVLAQIRGYPNDIVKYLMHKTEAEPSMGDTSVARDAAGRPITQERT